MLSIMKSLTAAVLTAALVLPVSMEAIYAEARLTDTTSVYGPDVELGEIASIETDDKTLESELVKLKVGQAPSVGRSRAISSYKIRAALEKAGHADLVLHGFQTIVYTESRKLEENELQDIIEEWARKGTPEAYEVEVEVLKAPTAWKVPKGDDVQIIVDAGRATPLGTVSLKLRAEVENRVLATSRARIKVSHYGPAAVLTRPLLRGEELTSDHVEVRRADISSGKGLHINTLDDVLGMTAKQNMGIGTLVDKRQFAAPVLIETGSLNRISIHNGGIRMSIAGAEALQNGRRGDLILFRNPMNKGQPLRARVSDQGLATIKLN